MEYHNDRFKDYSLLVYKNEELIALLPANINGDTLFSHQGLTYGGLVLSKSIKFKYVLEGFKFLLAYLVDKGINTLNLKQLPIFYASKTSNEIDFLCFKLGASLYRKDVLSVVDLKLEPIKYSKDRAEGVKRGLKNKLVVREVTTFEEFWNDILVPNLNAKHNTNPVHNLEEITMLKSKFPNNIRQFNVYKDATIVAGTTIFETKTVAHSQYISANADKNALGSLDFLYDYLLKIAFKDKSYFDFGMSHEHDGSINEGLMYWKEGFGARSYTQDFWQIKTEDFDKLNTVF